MKTAITIRRPHPAEYASVASVVQMVVDETFGGLWAPGPLQIDQEDWSLAWIGLIGASIAGMTLTHGEWLSDLWVLGDFRGMGAGATLLACAEAEISERGYVVARLRVVQSNASARAFYAAHGWTEKWDFRHERLPITMVEMEKSLAATG